MSSCVASESWLNRWRRERALPLVEGRVIRTLLMAVSIILAGLPQISQADAGSALPPKPAFSIAFYYATDIPWETLGAFDIAVVDPDNVKESGWTHRLNPSTEVAAYVSVGEVHPSRKFFPAMDAAWQVGKNTDWGSVVVDQTNPQWRKFFVERIVAPMWLRGHRAFFLDTLDSFHLVAKTPEAKAQQTAGLVSLIKELKSAYPQAKLIFNRGFEILPAVHGLAYAVAAESLFKGYDAGTKSYRDVPQNDRDWLWGQLKRCKDEWKLPVIGIDYVPPEDRAIARATAQRILALGAIPWVANPELNSLGVGAVEPLPRQVLALHDEDGHIAKVVQHEVHRLGAMPLNHLGLEQVLLRAGSAELDGYAERPLAGRFAGVLMWFNKGSFPKDPDVLTVFNRARREGVPVVIVGSLPEDAALEPFGMDIGTPLQATSEPELEVRSPHVGFEVLPRALVGEFWPATLREPDAAGTEVWLRVKAKPGAYSDAIAITPWGAYAQDRYWKLDLPQQKGERWAVQPIEFFRRGFRIDEGIPVPDVTSESGRRLLLIHIDGDGFPSRAEIPGAPLASEVMLTQFLQRYELPSTVSVIQGEVAGNGLHRALSPMMEEIARKMFRLPHVELATHTFSHPFYWAEAQLGLTRGDRAVGLRIPNYSFNIDTEIAGSADYINRILAPPGKRTRMLLWSGDTEPLEAPVKAAYAAGLLNMNSGYTTISKANPSLTLVAPIGVMKGEYFQVYAPNQNENVYTNDWLGPYYGFDRVIETFEMTESPKRLKPVNIYYHTYIASKPASIQSLHKVYQWAISQPLFPVYSSEYALRVLDWRRATVSRDWASPEGRHLELRAGGPHLRQWRAILRDGAQLKQGWAGHTKAGVHDFLNAISSVATYIENSSTEPQFDQKKGLAAAWQGPFMRSANARVTKWQRDAMNAADQWRIDLESAVGLSAQFDARCDPIQSQSSPGLTYTKKTTGWEVARPGKSGQPVSTQDGGKQTLVFRCTQ